MTSESERSDFSERLRSALAQAGYEPSPTVVAREFNLRTPDKPVSIFASRKWLMGEAIPTQDKVRVLADWLAAPAHWLRFGVEDSEKSPDVDSASSIKMNSLERTILGDYQRLNETNRFVIREMITVLLKAEQKRPIRAGR